MQQGRKDCNDAVVYELASNHSCLLKVVCSMQFGALGLVLCKPLPVSQLEDKLEQGECCPLHSRPLSWLMQGECCAARMLKPMQLVYDMLLAFAP